MNNTETRVLIAGLDDPDRSTRHEAAIALGGVRTPEAAAAHRYVPVAMRSGMG